MTYRFFMSVKHLIKTEQDKSINQMITTGYTTIPLKLPGYNTSIKYREL